VKANKNVIDVINAMKEGAWHQPEGEKRLKKLTKKINK